MLDLNVNISKFLSLILRHAPERIGLHLDANGWVAVDDLLNAAEVHGTVISRDLLDRIVFGNDKQRFAFSPDELRIRANQGHSLHVDLELTPTDPPPVLYHGTATRFLPSIRSQGLQSMSRLHVHLSATREQAYRVGTRHGPPVVLEVDAEGMADAGHLFFLSANGVWLTEFVPVQFVEFSIETSR
ncbi:putative RNA 2'-phosphotransferase [Candidatus Electrothrix marina]|uniref:Probable RNA 2'-phosphotransferase n=1 Tax=Candidatus Electrothrix marina TaxID=1859130 RepID=A0A444JDU0_9BACT|nr:putative RNA 2'-phosphotransferase [Candidatus Electrothrix marina]